MEKTQVFPSPDEKFKIKGRESVKKGGYREMAFLPTTISPLPHCSVCLEKVK